MRQISITAPQGSAREVAGIAFAAGIYEVTIGEKRTLTAGGSEIIKDSIEMEVGTHLSKTFLDDLTSKLFFSREEFSIAIRQPRSIVSREKLSTLVRPLVEPSFESLKSSGNSPR